MVVGGRAGRGATVFSVWWNRSIFPQVVGWFGLAFFWWTPRRPSSVSKALRPPLPPESRVAKTIPLSVSVEAGSPNWSTVRGTC